MAEVYRCTNCHQHPAEAMVEGSALCSTCYSASYQVTQTTVPTNPSSLQNIQICQSCQKVEAVQVCVCVYPLMAFCEGCGLAHRNKKISESHPLLPVALVQFIRSNEDLQRHKQRLVRIDQAKAELEGFSLSKLEDAKRDLDAGIEYLKSVLDSLHAEWTAQLASLQRTLDEEMRVLDELKTGLPCVTMNHLELWVVHGDSISQDELSEDFWSHFVCEYAWEVAAAGLRQAFSIKSPGTFINASSGFRGFLKTDNSALVQPEDPNFPRYTSATLPTAVLVNDMEGQNLWNMSPIARTAYTENPSEEASCRVCGKGFAVTQIWQYIQEGVQVCSYPCRSYYEQGTGTKCATCQMWVRDQSWWGSALQEYGTHKDHFQSFCSLQCCASHFQLIKDESSKIIPCEAKDSGNSSGYPQSKTPIPKEELKHATDHQESRLHTTQEEDVSDATNEAELQYTCDRCEILSPDKFYSCGHQICHQCKKLIWFGFRDECPICN